MPSSSFDFFNTPKKLWSAIGLSILLIAFAINDYLKLTALEQYGGIERVSRRTKRLYDLGGKWAVVGSTLVLGLALLFLVVASRFRNHHTQALPTKPPTQDKQRRSTVSAKPKRRSVVRRRPAIPTLAGTKSTGFTLASAEGPTEEPSILR